MSKLLTIAIPTYNRGEFLNACLEYILPQALAFKSEVDIYISDNASTDNTTNVLSRFRGLGYDFIYSSNEENKGADFNILKCFSAAESEYVWIFSDDDILRPDSLDKILDLLRREEFGLVNINSEWFNKSLPDIIPGFGGELDVKIFTDKTQFINKINIWTTFISGNIVSKKFTQNLEIEPFKKSHLVQLTWVFEAILNGSKSAIVENKLVVCRSNERVNYGLVKVFGINFNKILDYFIGRGLSPQIKKTINKSLLNHFFKHFALNGSFTKKDWLNFIWLYWYHKEFWTMYILKIK